MLFNVHSKVILTTAIEEKNKNKDRRIHKNSIKCRRILNLIYIIYHDIAFKVLPVRLIVVYQIHNNLYILH